jgi:XTP/dITP diphosphohydrolase
MTIKLAQGDSLVIASHNKGKLAEFERMLKPLGITMMSAGELGVPEPEETGESFHENAQLKAAIAAFATNRLALGDDSGVEIAALNGAPGIYTARWAGETRDFRIAMQRAQDELAAKDAHRPDQRRAAFVCVLCLANPIGDVQFFEGRVEGCLVWPPRGENGFGYDPMFQPDGYTQTYGEMDPAQKYAITHRARAFAKFRDAITGNGIASGG